MRQQEQHQQQPQPTIHNPTVATATLWRTTSTARPELINPRFSVAARNRPQPWRSRSLSPPPTVTTVTTSTTTTTKL
jgi:hypothetical protein